MISSSEAQRPNILVALPTYRRVGLLPELIARVREEIERTDAHTRILVLDNDPERSAEAVAASIAAPYAAQPDPGIAATRQAGLNAAADDELVVMIDDDLVPEPGWLAGLLDAWHQHRPAVVMGYVRYVWPAGTDPWVAAGGFMRRSHYPTGHEIDTLATGNVLIDTAQVRELGVAFDASMGLSGGSDEQFGRDLVAAGGRIVASADSVARDDVVAERVEIAALRERTICQGQAHVRILMRDQTVGGHIAKRAGHLVGGLIRLPTFTAAERLARLRGDIPASAVYRRRAWFAQGRILATLGRSTYLYARDPAPTASTRQSASGMIVS